ncbi:MAG: hypothetical protein ACSHX8_14205 [Opitutaceae bacterium]
MKRTYYIILLFLVLCSPSFADQEAGTQARVAEIDKALKESEQRIRIYSSNSVRYASLIDAERVKVARLQAEKQALMPELASMQLDKAQKARLKLARDLEHSMRRALESFRFITNGPSTKGNESSEAREFQKLQNAYLTLMMDFMLSEANESQSSRVDKLRGIGEKELQLAMISALDSVDAVKSGQPDYTVTVTQSNAEAHYRFARLKLEAATMAELTLDKGNGRQTQEVVEVLIGEIVANDTSNPAPQNDGRAAKTHKWFQEMKRVVDLEEFRRMAAFAPIFDEGKLVTGKTRQEIAYFSELALANRVKRSAVTMPISRIFWPADSRVDLATEIEKAARDNPDHVIFGYLQTGVEPSPRMYMLAIMRTLRYEQEKINTWLVESINKPWFETGLGTLLRVSDGPGTGDAGFAEVKKRIDQYMNDVDTVHDVFQRATKADEPEKLDQKDQDLLSAFGYVVTGPDGSLVYAVPKKANIGGLTASAQRGLKLPGAPVLDVINVKNISITVITTLVPGYAATMVEGALLRAGAGMRTIFAAKVGTEMGLGMAFDAASQMSETGRVDVETLLIESVLLGGLIERAEKLTMGQGGKMTDALVNYKNKSLLREVLSDETVRKKAGAWVQNSLGLANENAITLAYESLYKGTELDQHTFFANLVNSSLTRSISNTSAAIHSGDFLPPHNKYVEHLPKWLQFFVQKDPALGREIYNLSHEQAKMKEAALGRYNEAVGPGKPSADRLFSALLKGDLSWMDLTMAYQNDTETMKPLMHQVKDLRDTFFQEIEVDALQLAHKELDDVLYQRIEEGMEFGEAMQLYLHDWRYLTEQVISPGSKSPVSDIDRSMQHPRLRQLMEHMFEVRADSGGSYMPTSARAFDVNEYYNVMPFITKLNEMRGQLDPVVLKNGLKHADVMSSFGFAAAMMHMNGPQQRHFRVSERKRWEQALFDKSIIKGSPAYHEGMAQFELLLNMAKDDLKRGREELAAKIEEMEIPSNEPDAEVRARSALYQERIDVYYEKLKKIDTMKGSEADKIALHAEIERDMAFLLREGIETYSGSGTLDIIVVQIQIAGVPMEHALTNKEHTLDGKLSNLSPEQIDFMVHDQCLMMVEHINGYYHGHELPYNSGKALAKYAQRALLAMKIKGDIDINALKAAGDTEHPVLKLHELTSSLMAQKANPKAFDKLLSDYTTDGTPDAGLKKLMSMIEEVVPGMERQSLVDNFAHLAQVQVGDKNPFVVNSTFRSHKYVAQREEAATAGKVMAYGGGALLEQYALSKLEQTRLFLEQVRERFKLYEEMGRHYEPVDWREVLRLKRALHGLSLVSSNVPGEPQPDWGKRITQPMHKMNERLSELEKPRESTFSRTGYSQFGRLWLQMQSLLVDEEYFVAMVKRAQERKALEAALDKISLSGVWVFDRGAHKGRAKIEHNGQQVKIWLTSEAISAKPPHFFLDGVYKRGRIVGRWEELHSPKLKVKGTYATAAQWNNVGSYTADVALEPRSFTMSDRTTELKGDHVTGWSWTGLQFFPAVDGVRAPTNLKILSVEQKPMEQKKPSESKPREPRHGKGNLWVVQQKADGGDASNAFEIYEMGAYGTANQDLVAKGMTNSTLELSAGVYELIIGKGKAASRRPVTIAPGQVTRMILPKMGRLRLQMLDANGRPFIDDHFQLRVMQGKESFGWCSDTGSSLAPGSYSAVLYYDHDPIRLRSDYKQVVEVSEGSETIVTARFGSYQLDLTDADGKPFAWRTNLEVTFKNEDGSLGFTDSFEPGKRVNLLPGTYRVSCRLFSGAKYIQEVNIIPAEHNQSAVPMGRLDVMIDAKASPSSKEYTLILTRKDISAADAIVVNDLSQINLFPGTYEGHVFSAKKGQSARKTFRIEAGRSTFETFLTKKN